MFYARKTFNIILGVPAMLSIVAGMFYIVSATFIVNAQTLPTDCAKQGMNPDNAVATLRAIGGEILVYQGIKYVPAAAGMRLGNGDRLLAMKHSSAVVSYDNGCLTNVTSFDIYDVHSCSQACVGQLQNTQPTQVKATNVSPVSSSQSTMAASTPPAPATVAPPSVPPGATTPGAATGSTATTTSSSAGVSAGTTASSSSAAAGAGAATPGTVTTATAGSATGSSAAVTAGALGNPGVIATGIVAGTIIFGEELGLDKMLNKIGIDLFGSEEDNPVSP